LSLWDPVILSLVCGNIEKEERKWAREKDRKG
jgi:hypothetical protein